MIQLRLSKVPKALGLLVAPLALCSVAFADGEGVTFQPVYGGGIDQAEILARQQAVIEANAAYERGVRAGKDRDYELAYEELSYALEVVPYGTMTEAHRKAYAEAYEKYAVLYAEEIAKNAKAAQAQAIVESVLDYSPNNRRAARLLEQIEAGEFVNDPTHEGKVENVDQLLKEGQSDYRLGKFQDAKKKFYQVLRVDRYNSAAQRGLEQVENAEYAYHEHARSHTRAAFIRQVEEQWELPIPLAVDEGLFDGLGAYQDSGLGFITAKLNQIIIPQLTMNGFRLETAINYLRRRSAELDPDPTNKGVNIVIDRRRINNSTPGALDQPVITLDLEDVPLAEALRYVTELAGVKYRIEPFAVWIVPLTDREEALFTRRYRVPPFFTSMGGGAGDAGAAATDDPFAAPGDDAAGPGLAAKRGAKEILESQGIVFEEGATAFYISSASELVVRNTPAQLEVVDQYVQKIIQEGVPKQIKVESKFVEIAQDDTKEVSFDWLMGGFELGANIWGGGGTLGTSPRFFDSTQFPFFGNTGAINPDFPLNPVTAGLRSGSEAIRQSAIEALIAAGRAGALSEFSTPAPGAFAVAGVLTDPQFTVIMRLLDQRKGTDLLTAPSVLTRSAQAAQVEVIRELIYPTEYDPPEIPQEVGVGTIDLGGGVIDPGMGGGGATFPVTPATPTAFETRNTGVTLRVTPQVGPDGYTIEMDLVPEVVEFEGFVNYGSPITTSATDILGNPREVILTENRIEMPVFATRRVTTNVTVYDGNTVVIGGLIKEDVQHVNDKVPILGDVPILGRLFRSESEERKKRNLMVFVTARLIDPSGRPVNEDEEEVDEGPDTALFPEPELIPEPSYGKNPIYGKNPSYRK
jgi:general secretion pathway protein D